MTAITITAITETARETRTVKEKRITARKKDPKTVREITADLKRENTEEAEETANTARRRTGTAAVLRRRQWKISEKIMSVSKRTSGWRSPASIP